MGGCARESKPTRQQGSCALLAGGVTLASARLPATPTHQQGTGSLLAGHYRTVWCDDISVEFLQVLSNWKVLSLNFLSWYMGLKNNKSIWLYIE